VFSSKPGFHTLLTLQWKRTSTGETGLVSPTDENFRFQKQIVLPSTVGLARHQAALHHRGLQSNHHTTVLLFQPAIL
jgi:hypothetical protein